MSRRSKDHGGTPEAATAAETAAVSSAVDDILSRYGVTVPDVEPPDVGKLVHATEDPFEAIGEGVDTSRYEYYRAYVNPDPSIGDLTVRLKEKQGFVRLPAGFPARLAGVSGPNDVMMIRSKEVAAAKDAEERAVRDARQYRAPPVVRELAPEVTNRITSTRRRMPLGLM